MKWLDRYLQKVRIRKAGAHLPDFSRVLDIGCHQGELFNQLQHKHLTGTGIDLLIENAKTIADGTVQLIPGSFPAALQTHEQFDAITALAVVEHIPEVDLQDFFCACYAHLKTGGLLICTVPDSKVDSILSMLNKLALVDGMSIDDHHEFDAMQTIALAAKAGFKLLSHKTFQLGLNNVFVFGK